MVPNRISLRFLFRLFPILFVALTPFAASSQSIQVSFASPLVLAPAATSGAWYTDRYAPGAFVSQQIAPDGTRNTLEESIYPSGFQSPTPSFYNTQGRSYQLVSNTYSTSILVYVPSSWATENGRVAGFWGTAINSSSGVGDYPIIEFQGPTTSDLGGPSYYPNGGVAGFYGWNNVNSSYDYIGLPPHFQYNSWVQLTITLIPGIGFQYSVNDPLSRHGASIASPASDVTDSALGSVLLQGYNYDQSYSIFWNKLTMTSSTLACSTKFRYPNGPGRHRP